MTTNGEASSAAATDHSVHQAEAEGALVRVDNVVAGEFDKRRRARQEA